MKTRLMISSAMTPAEQAAGRFMRAPDGHPEDGAVMIEVPDSPPAESKDEPSTEKSVDDQYNEEFGSVEPDADDNVDGDDGKEPSEKKEPEPEPEGVALQRRLDELEQAKLQLERELEEVRRAKPTEAPKEEQVSQEVKAPNPADYEFGAADERFIADNARWHAEQRFNELEAAKQFEAEVEKVESKWKQASSGDDIKETYPDFEEKVIKGADRKDWFCSPAMALLIKNSDAGPHVAYELASNAEESKRIAALPPHEQLLEFGRLEGRAMARRELAAAAPPAPAKRATSAPTPPAARSRGNGGQFASPQDALYDKMLSEFN